MKGHWKFLGGRGVLKARFLEAMYENKLEFPGGWCKTKKPSVGGVWIFSGAAHYYKSANVIFDTVQKYKSFTFASPRFNWDIPLISEDKPKISKDSLTSQLQLYS